MSFIPGVRAFGRQRLREQVVSRPFAAPKSGKIAVKVINHYGDDVLKVYRVGI